MKPIRLKMIAFGPYGGTEEIDFNNLRGKNIFLISGKTGAGKTTIFDGICYGLYGETSNSERSAESLRSQFAQESTITEVDLEFELKGRRYKITRKPKQRRKKLRGEGTVEINSDAILEFLDEDRKPLKGVKNVTNKVEELMGINGEQFRQIIMIPQGEFRKLLLSDSQDREKVLRKIFDTSVYNVIQRKLDERAKAIYSSIKNERAVIENAYDRFVVDGDDQSDTAQKLRGLLSNEEKSSQDILQVVKEYAQEDRNRDKNIKAVIGEISQKIKSELERKTKGENKNRDIDNFEALVREENSLKEEKNRIDSVEKKLKNGTKAEKISSYEQRVVTIKDELNKAESRMKALESEGENITKELQNQKQELAEVDTKERSEELNQKKSQLFVLKEVMEKVKEIEEKSMLLRRVKSELQESEREHGELKSYIEELEKKIRDNEQQKNHIGDSLSKLRDVKGDLNISEREYSDLKIKSEQYRREYEQLKKIYIDRLQIEKKLKKFAEEIERKEDEKIQLYNLFKESQGAILAEKLSAGERCPVCGSVEHPHMAKSRGRIVDIKELEDVDKNISRLREEKSSLDVEASKYRERFQGSKRNLDNLRVEIGEKFEITISPEEKGDVSIERFNFKLKSISEDIENLKKKILERKELEDSEKNLGSIIEQSKSEHVKKSDLLKEKDEKLRKDRELQIKYKSSLDELQRGLREEDTVESVSVKIEEINEYILKWEKKIEILRTQLQENEKKLAAKKAQIDEVRKILQDTKEKCLKYNEEFKEVISKFFHGEEEYYEAKTYIPDLEEMVNQIQNYKEKCSENSTRQLEIKNRLDDFEKINMQEIHEKIVLLENEREIEESSRRKIQSRLENNESIMREILEKSEKIKDREAEYSKVGHLCKITKGDNLYRMTFERYVLAAFLEDILNAANLRLKKMTGNRYMLSRTDELERKNKQSGLELAVFDNYTGLSRHVKTLSGGESFKASLSMALGLSDVVQSYAGGVRLDTMFIDEGFGSLDPESLDNAIECLVDLQKSGRLVGIISHVPELKERIQAQLVVDSSNRGSFTKFIVN